MATSPGRIGPGLIEAEHLFELKDIKDVHLPGESARASLKHSQTSARYRWHRQHLPGESARASLKLYGHREYAPAGASNLPGESARASLKRLPSTVRHCLPPISPGRIGPGLIEAPHRRPPKAWASLSPGRIGPGLIEAFSNFGSIPLASPASPGRIGPGLIEALRTSRVRTGWSFKSPGRIGPGLIEAIALHSASLSPTDISRANRPGPH